MSVTLKTIRTVLYGEIMQVADASSTVQILTRALGEYPVCFVNCLNAFNPLNAELNPIRHLLALVRARHTVHVSRIRVNFGTAGGKFGYLNLLATDFFFKF